MRLESRLTVCVTNQLFNENATRHAGLNKVELYDQRRLADLLERTPVMMLDIDRFLYNAWKRETGNRVACLRVYPYSFRITLAPYFRGESCNACRAAGSGKWRTAPPARDIAG